MEEFTYNDITQPNRNKLLYQVQGADGLKTGFTKESGWGIAATALRNDRRITVVINGTNSSRSRLNESSNLINWAFNQTSQQTLVEKDQFITEVDVWLGSESSINLISAKKLVSNPPISQKILLRITKHAPVAQKIGTVKLYCPLSISQLLINLPRQKGIPKASI